MRQTKPLAGKRIVVTRARAQAAELSEPLRALGAEVLELPTIKIVPPQDPSILREAIEGIGEYDWIIFTSANAVDYFFAEFFRQYDDIRALGLVRLATIGAGTAKKLAALHLRVDLQPKKAVAEALVKAFKQTMDVANLRILLPRADIGRDTMLRGLEELGAIVDDVEAYRTVAEDTDPEGAAQRLMELGADVVTFASSSAAENFCRRIDVATLCAKFPNLRFASIGPATTQTAERLGLRVSIEAAEHGIEGLVKAIVAEFSKPRTTAARNNPRSSAKPPANSWSE